MKTMVAILVLSLTLTLANALTWDANEGQTWNIPMRWAGSGNEVEIRTQGMCDGAFWLNFEWNKAQDLLRIRFKGYGLPALPTICYEFNPSNAYNQWPYPCVTGRWQLYIVSKVYKIPVTCFYHPVTKILLGTDYDSYGNTIPANAIQVPCNGMSMITTRQFTPSILGGVADETFTLSYSDLRDEYGSSGTLLSLPLRNLSDPLSFLNLYTNQNQLKKPIPRVNFEDIIYDINNSPNPAAPGLFGAGLTYVPLIKPDYLKSRDNLMLGPFGMLNSQPSTPGYDVAQCAAEFQGRPKFCGTFQLNNFFPFLHGC